MSRPNISDAEIGVAADFPDIRASVNATLMGKLRERQRRNYQVFRIPSDINDTEQAESLDWTTVATLAIKPPTHLRGDLGSTLSIEALCKYQNHLPLASYEATAQYRIEVVGYETVVSNAHSIQWPNDSHVDGLVSEYAELNATGFWMHPHASGPTLVTVNFQVWIECGIEFTVPATKPVISIAVGKGRGPVHYMRPEPQ